MALIDRSVVKVYKSKFNYSENLTVLKGVLFELEDNEKVMPQVDNPANTPLNNPDIFRLNFGVDSYIYMNLNNDNLKDSYAGEKDLRTGLDLSYLVIDEATFHLPTADGNTVSPELPFDQLKYFLEGLTEAKISAIAGTSQNDIDAFRRYNITAGAYKLIRTESGSKITFTNDPLYNEFNKAAHS